MIISDLNHVEVVSKDQEIVGGSYYYYYPSAKAYASAHALAIGHKTYTNTHTSAVAVKGVYSSSNSSSYADAY